MGEMGLFLGEAQRRGGKGAEGSLPKIGKLICTRGKCIFPSKLTLDGSGGTYQKINHPISVKGQKPQIRFTLTMQFALLLPFCSFSKIKYFHKPSEINYTL